MREESAKKLIGAKIIRIVETAFGDVDIFCKTINDDEIQISISSNEYQVFNQFVGFDNTEDGAKIYS